MKKQFLSFLLLLSFVFSISAQKAQLSNASEKNLRTHVEYLASDQLEGRRTGETGATYAAGYVANLFANYKLKAGFSQSANGKTNQNYLQTFPLVTSVEMAEKGNALGVDVSNNDGQTMTFSDELAFRPAAFSPNAEIGNTQAVFVGYGISSTDPKYDDYKNANINGRIVVAFDGTPEMDNPHSLFGRFNRHAKALIAKEKGAIALLLISREAKLETNKAAQLKYDQTFGEAALPTMMISRKTGAEILGTDEAGLKRAEENLIQTAKVGTSPVASLSTKAVVNLKINLVKKTADAYNVVGILEGTDAVLKNEAIVIGAHYDHLGRGGNGSLDINSKEIHHGADDNASGVAAMLELAREFSQSRNNKRTIIFIAFGGEEEGLLGSQFYVNNPAFPIEKTIAMINLDMVGRLKDEKLTVGGIGTASEWKNLVEAKNPKAIRAGELEGTTGMLYVPAFKLQLNEDGFGPSDHSSFYAKKVPVLFFFTGTHENYHKPSDTADKINYEGLLKITGYVSEIIRAIDQNPKPTYTVAKSSGMMGGRTGFNVSLGTVPNYADGNNDGLLLDGVRENSPAAKAGLKAGDKVVKLAGREVRNISDYTFVLGEMKAGVEYQVEIQRGAERLTLKIVPAPAAKR